MVRICCFGLRELLSRYKYFGWIIGLFATFKQFETNNNNIIRVLPVDIKTLHRHFEQRC